MRHKQPRFKAGCTDMPEKQEETCTLKGKGGVALPGLIGGMDKNGLEKTNCYIRLWPNFLEE